MTLSYEEAKAQIRATSQKAMQALYRERKGTAIAAYGGMCVVCGNDDHPDLMVVPKKGWQWSRGVGMKPIRGGHEKLRWLDKNNWPDSHTLVCGPAYSPCRYALQKLDL